MRLVFAERARQDLSDIYDAIAEDSLVGAKRVEDAIRQQCNRLADFPFASATTNEPYVRRVPLAQFPFSIFFRILPSADTVEIARVLRSSRVRDLRRMP